MGKERTLSIIKPDAVRENHVGDILSRFEKAGLKIIAAKMKLHKKGQLSDRERQRLEREVEAHESRIDELVRQLYGLTDEEIGIVEDAN